METPLSRNRRQFLRFLAASPLISKVWADEAASVITNPKDAINVMDFEPLSRKAIPPAHWGYMATGVDDDATLKANMEGFKHFELRPHRLVDVSKADMHVEVFGSTWESPIFLCPVGGQKAFHPEGEVAVARAAKTKRMTQILSTQTSSSIEDVAKALGTAPWYQLYMPLKWEDTEKMIRRVEATGCPAVAWTVDLLAGRNTETAERFRRIDTRDCMSCHPTAQGGGSPKPMFKGLANGFNPPEATWAYVDRLKKLTKMKLLLKGLDTAEDAKLAVEHGADGIILSNHGGRATETLRATIECLPEVVESVNGRIPVLIDGGFRRGTDVYKALALGARAVGIGRPYIYGVSAFGTPGVERVIDILRAELSLIMRQCGTPSIAQITRASVMHNGSRV